MEAGTKLLGQLGHGVGAWAACLEPSQPARLAGEWDGGVGGKALEVLLGHSRDSEPSVFLTPS